MSNIDFNFGHNVDEPAEREPLTPTVAGGDSGCFGLLVCPHCGKSAMCSDIGDNEQMINRGNNQSNGNQRQQRAPRNGLPFLTTQQCSMSPQPGTIISARVEPNPYKRNEEQVSLRIEFRGNHYLFALRNGNPSLDYLVDGLGDDETSWANKPVRIFNEEDSHNAKLWVRIEPAQESSDEATATKTSKRRS